MAEDTLAPRFVDVRVHPCGCKTRFDVEKWRSETVDYCAWHVPNIPKEQA